MSPAKDHADGTSWVAGWLSRYLGVTMFLTGLAGTALGALITGVIGWSSVNNELQTHQKLLDAQDARQKVFEVGMVDVDRRLNQGVVNLLESERRSHDEIQATHEQIAVVKAEVELFGARTIPPQTQGGK